MSDAVIRLDRSKQFSECRGERTPDDPHYHVHFWQGRMVGKDMVLLPFDANDALVPDDGKTETWQGRDSENKPVTHYPLYNKPMRDLLERMRKRQADLSARADAGPEEDDLEDAVAVSDDVNFPAMFRGEARYEWPLVVAAAKKRYSRIFTSKRELVTDLILDEKVIPEEQLSQEWAKLLPARAA